MISPGTTSTDVTRYDMVFGKMPALSSTLACGHPRAYRSSAPCLRNNGTLDTADAGPPQRAKPGNIASSCPCTPRSEHHPKTQILSWYRKQKGSRPLTPNIFRMLERALAGMLRSVWNLSALLTILGPSTTTETKHVSNKLNTRKNLACLSAARPGLSVPQHTCL